MSKKQAGHAYRGLPETQTRELEAIHEAAHAVVALALGMKVYKISIEIEGLSGGHVIMSAPADQQAKMISVTCASILAIARYCRQHRLDSKLIGWGVGDDMHQMDRIAREIVAGGKRRLNQEERAKMGKLILQARDESQQILDQPHMWRAVEALAALLLERQTISGEEAREAIKQCVSNERPAQGNA